MTRFRSLASVVAIAVLVLLLASPMVASAETAQTAGGPGCAQWYTIKWGDTLSKIAVKFGTTVHKLADLNGIADPDFIIAGTTICVKAKPAGFYYVVQKGDTLGNIGWKYGWGALTLAKVNGIANPDLIFPGQVLWIPAH